MGNEIFVFSGTGNSMHVATELQKKIPETEIISIIEVMKSGGKIKSAGSTVGVVFPLHFFTLPHLVRTFFSRFEPQSAKYLFALVTRGGSESDACQLINRLLRPSRRTLDGFFYINMINNQQIVHFENVTEAMCAEMEQSLQEKLASICTKILATERFREMDDRPPVLEGLMKSSLKAFGLSVGRHLIGMSWYAEPSCTACGVCAQVCPAGKIVMQDRRPLWLRQNRCTNCFGCINYCPVQAIQIKGFESKTKRSGRYHHPQIEPWQIGWQKEPGVG